MAIGFPIDPTKPIVFERPARGWTGILSTANSYTALDSGVIVFASEAADGLFWPADTVAEATVLLMLPVVPGTPATVLARGSEINSDNIADQGFDFAEIKARSEELGIIIREPVAEIRFGPAP